jgi:hypothetical protein
LKVLSLYFKLDRAQPRTRTLLKQLAKCTVLTTTPRRHCTAVLCKKTPPRFGHLGPDSEVATHRTTYLTIFKRAMHGNLKMVRYVLGGALLPGGRTGVVPPPPPAPPFSKLRPCMTCRGRQDHLFFDLKSNQSLDLFLSIFKKI